MIITVNMLRRVELFSGLSDHSLGQIISQSRLVSKSKGETIFMQGSAGQRCYLIIGGQVRLFKTNPEGIETTVAIFGEDNVFGEVILFESDYYPVSSVAVVDSILLEIRKSEFQNLFNDPRFCKDFAKMLVKKLRYTTQRIEYLSSYDVEERFFRYLLENFGRKRTYSLEIPKKDIANAIGTIPETFSRLIAKLKKRGVIKYDGEKLEILDDDVLERII